MRFARVRGNGMIWFSNCLVLGEVPASCANVLVSVSTFCQSRGAEVFSRSKRTLALGHRTGYRNEVCVPAGERSSLVASTASVHLLQANNVVSLNGDVSQGCRDWKGQLPKVHIMFVFRKLLPAIHGGWSKQGLADLKQQQKRLSRILK